MTSDSIAQVRLNFHVSLTRAVSLLRKLRRGETVVITATGGGFEIYMPQQFVGALAAPRATKRKAKKVGRRKTPY